MSWRQIAKVDPYSGIPPGTLATMLKDSYIPNKWRSQLGLDVDTPITPIGKVAPRSQALESLVCVVCARPFIPNHPRRRKCYLCSPTQRK